VSAEHGSHGMPGMRRTRCSPRLRERQKTGLRAMHPPAKEPMHRGERGECYGKQHLLAAMGRHHGTQGRKTIKQLLGATKFVLKRVCMAWRSAGKRRGEKINLRGAQEWVGP